MNILDLIRALSMAEDVSLLARIVIYVLAAATIAGCMAGIAVSVQKIYSVYRSIRAQMRIVRFLQSLFK